MIEFRKSRKPIIIGYFAVAIAAGTGYLVLHLSLVMALLWLDKDFPRRPKKKESTCAIVEST